MRKNEQLITFQLTIFDLYSVQLDQGFLVFILASFVKTSIFSRSSMIDLFTD
jgi:hypothetical protein